MHQPALEGGHSSPGGGGGCTHTTEAAVDGMTIQDAFDDWSLQTEWEGTVASNCSLTDGNADCFWISTGGRWNWSKDTTAGLSPVPGGSHDAPGGSGPVPT